MATWIVHLLLHTWWQICKVVQNISAKHDLHDKPKVRLTDDRDQGDHS